MSQPHDDTAPGRARPDGDACPAGEPARPRADARRPRRPDQRRPRGRGAARRRHRPAAGTSTTTPPPASGAGRRAGCRCARGPAARAGVAAAAPRGRGGRRRACWASAVFLSSPAGDLAASIGAPGTTRVGPGLRRRTPAAVPAAPSRRRRPRVAPERGVRRGRRRHVRASTTPSDRLDVDRPCRSTTARSTRSPTSAAESPALGPIATPLGARSVRRPRSASRPTPASSSTWPRSTASRRPSSSSHAGAGPHGVGGRPLLHHRHHRPHPWPGVARLSPAGPPAAFARPAGRGRRGNTAAVGSVPRRHRILRSPPATTTRGCVP